MSEYKHTTSTPKVFEGVGRLSSADLYAWAGVFHNLSLSVRSALTGAIRNSETYDLERAERNAGTGCGRAYAEFAAECRALLDAIQDAPAKAYSEHRETDAPPLN